MVIILFLAVKKVRWIFRLFLIQWIFLGFTEQSEVENSERNRSLSWEFDDGDISNNSSSSESVSEVMEFFEMAASLIRTLAPDSVSKGTPKTN